MKVDVISAHSHYQDHLLPIFECLPPSMQGRIHPVGESHPNKSRVALVAGWEDVQPLRDRCRMIYVEHGAGQSYAGGDGKSAHHPGYSGAGGARHWGVIGFIAPNQVVADRWTTAPSIAVGCPKLDQFSGMWPSPGDSPGVCFAWHWPCQLAPEMRTALPHYEHRLPEITRRFKQQGFTVYGHAHPRWGGVLDERYMEAGAEILATDREVFLNADILIVDNSSLGVEFMSLDRPVVWMNAPWYRRDVDHGGRFWRWTEGIPTVDGPEALEALNLWDVLRSEDETREARASIVNETYAYTDGSSSQRAADFIEKLIFGE